VVVKKKIPSPNEDSVTDLGLRFKTLEHKKKCPPEPPFPELGFKSLEQTKI
jgi:hypothetical protein